MIPLPSEFEAVVPQECDGVLCNPSCETVRTAMLTFPILGLRFVQGWSTDAGGMGEELRQQICDMNCGGSPSTSSSSSSSES